MASKYEEAKGSSAQPTQIRSVGYQQYAFGDNYGNARTFAKPEEDDRQQAKDHTMLLRKGQSQHQDHKAATRHRLEEEKEKEGNTTASTKLVSSLKPGSNSSQYEGMGSSAAMDKLNMNYSKKATSEILGRGYGYSATGLSNIGNTCFMNSILQCIFASAPLNKYFLADFSKEKAVRRRSLSESYLALLKSTRMSQGGTVAPRDLKN